MGKFSIQAFQINLNHIIALRVPDSSLSDKKYETANFPMRHLVEVDASYVNDLHEEKREDKRILDAAYRDDNKMRELIESILTVLGLLQIKEANELAILQAKLAIYSQYNANRLGTMTDALREEEILLERVLGKIAPEAHTIPTNPYASAQQLLEDRQKAISDFKLAAEYIKAHYVEYLRVGLVERKTQLALIARARAEIDSNASNGSAVVNQSAPTVATTMQAEVSTPIKLPASIPAAVSPITEPLAAASTADLLKTLTGDYDAARVARRKLEEQRLELEKNLEKQRLELEAQYIDSPSNPAEYFSAVKEMINDFYMHCNKLVRGALYLYKEKTINTFSLIHNEDGVIRAIDYREQFNKYVGSDVFKGIRDQLLAEVAYFEERNARLNDGVAMVIKNGFIATLELYIAKVDELIEDRKGGNWDKHSLRAYLVGARNSLVARKKSLETTEVITKTVDKRVGEGGSATIQPVEMQVYVDANLDQIKQHSLKLIFACPRFPTENEMKLEKEKYEAKLAAATRLKR